MQLLKGPAEKGLNSARLKDVKKYGPFIFLFIAIIFFGVQYSFISSAAFEESFDFVRDEEELIEAIGEVEDFGWWVSGTLETTSGTNGTSGYAFFHYKVIGAYDEATVHIELEKATSNNYWEVTDFYFTQ